MSSERRANVRAPELYVLTLPLGWRKPPGWQRAFRTARSSDATPEMIERVASVLDELALACRSGLTEDERARWARAVLAAAFDDQAVDTPNDPGEAKLSPHRAPRFPHGAPKRIP